MTASVRDPVLLTPLDNFLPQVADYVQNLLFFHDSGNERDATAQHMRNAFTRMMDAIPWIAGSVTHIKHETQHGRLAIAAPWMTVDDLLTINHLDHLEYAKLKAEHFPLQALVKEDVWPQSKLTERPTLQAQVNFIQGGMILAVSAAHSTTDGNSLVTIMNVWAAYCRKEDGSLLLGLDSLNRGRLMTGLPAKFRDFDEYIELPGRKQVPEHGLALPFYKSYEWVSTRMKTSLVSALRIFSDLITYRRILIGARKPIDEGTRQVEIFFFSAARLRELKQAVSASRYDEGQRESGAWISTHDALVSLLWCCITQTWKDSNYLDRDSNPNPLLRLQKQFALWTSQPISRLTFFINGRRLIKDPPLRSYIGNVVLVNSLEGPFDAVHPTLKSVSRHAYALRRKVDEYDEKYLMRLVGAFGTVPDITRTGLSQGSFPQSQVSINSWASQDMYATDWGSEVGGHPERFRYLPVPFDPLCTVMPKLDAKDGWSEDECGLEVAVQLKSTNMCMLKRIAIFNRYAEWRCS